MQKRGSKYFACRPPPIITWPWGWDQNVKIYLFQNIVMLHINVWNQECSNMVANILPTDPPPDPAGM